MTLQADGAADGSADPAKVPDGQPASQTPPASDGANGDAGAQTPPASGSDGASGGGSNAADGAKDGEVQPYKPEGLDERHLGKTDAETIDNLLKQNKGFRETVGKLGEVPKDADGYPDPQFSEDFVKEYGDPKGDPEALKLVKAVLHKAGVPTGMAGAVISGVVEEAVKSGLIERPLNPDAEIEAAGGKDAYDKRASNLNTVIDGLAGKGFTEAEQRELRTLVPTAAGQLALEKLMNQPNGFAGGEGGSQYRSKEDVQRAMRDDRYMPNSPKFDEAYVNQVREAAKRLGM